MANPNDALDWTTGTKNAKAFRDSDTYKAIEEGGVDAEYVYNYDLPPSDSEDAKAIVTENGLLDKSNEFGQTWLKGSRMMADFHLKRLNATHEGAWSKLKNLTMPYATQGLTNLRSNIDTPPVENQDPNVKPVISTSLSDNMSDEEVAQFGLELSGMNEHNFLFGAGTWADSDDYPPEILVAMAGLLDLYSKLPDFTWTGTKRLAKGVLTDPTTYGVGLASLKVVKELLKGGSKQFGKHALRNKLLAKALGSSFVGVEGAGYAAMFDMFKQKMEAGDQPFEYDYGRIGQNAAIGFGAGTLLTGGLLATPAAVKGGKKLLGKAGDLIDDLVGDGTVVRSGVGPTDTAPTSLGGRLTRGDTAQIKALAAGDRVKEELASSVIRDLRAKYPPSEGWDKFEVTGGKFKKNKKGELVFKPKFRQPAYAFHIPKGRKKYKTHVDDISNKMVGDVQKIVARAQNGDKAAQEILAQARWYRDTSVKLRKQFGGLGDLFGDIVGSTSAQTNVRQNMENALIVLGRFSRGEFDEEIKAYAARRASGEPMGSKTLHPLFKAGEFPLITKATGELFNSNSPAATEALLGIFRDVKQGRSPKTLNFVKNILDIGDEATIDVWAARYLRDLTEQPRIMPKAEKAVAGKHLVRSTFEESRVGSEFKFGQDVFEKASKRINEEGIINDIDPTLGELTPKDLQAVAWFMEKEKWAKMGHPDIGGSASDELALAGSKNQDRISELRDILGQAGYSAAQKAAAQAELKTLEAPLERTVLGVSPEREGRVPTNLVMAETASALDAPIRSQDAAIGYQLNNSYGRFRFPGDDGKMIDVTERSLNAEIVAREDFNPEPVWDALVKTAIKYDQDSVFMAKIVDKATPNGKPGTELFFKRRMPENFAEGVVKDLRKLGVDGFTFITDARQSDRFDVQASASPSAKSGTAGLTGVRWIYVPEYDPKWPASGSPAEQSKYLDSIEDKFIDIMETVLTKYKDDIATGNVLHFDVRTANKPEGGWK